MTALNPVALTVAYHAALERRDFTALNTMFADTASYVSVGVGATKGKTQILAAFQQYFLTHPDHTSRDHDVQETGPCAARARWSLEARQSAGGDLIRRSGTEDITFSAAGQILEISVTDD